MQRRTFLIWFSRAVYAGCAAVVAGVGARFLAAPMSSAAATSGPVRRRIATLDSLPIGEPQLRDVRGVRQDAWTRYPEQVIGRVWVTRTGPAEAPPERAQITVFNASCPHSGCPVQKAAETGYLCPCHGAKFQPDGARVTDVEGYTNPSPRGMDPLDHRLVKDEATGRWWVEVEYQEFEVGLAERVEKV